MIRAVGLAGFSVLRAVAVALAVPASVALIIANYDDMAQRGKAFALYGFGIMVAGLLAPLLMGFVADKLSWRIPFALEVLVVLVALVLARHMRETETVKARVDVLGTVFTFLGIVAPDLVPLMDTDGLATERWQPRGLPATFLVDPENRIRYQALGGRAWDTPVYTEFLRKLAGKGATPPAVH